MGHTLVSGGGDNTIKLWNVTTGKLLTTLEGHTTYIEGVDFCADGRLLASKGADGTLNLWNCDTWDPVIVIQEPANPGWEINGFASHPMLPFLATVGSEPNTPEKHRCKDVHLWELDLDILLKTSDYGRVPRAVRYTTAKIVLVGDSGVGKTGLGWRLAHGEFKEHSSTHGQQFWVIPNLGLQLDDGTECEAVLWDLAGQPDYRLVHSLFLDDVDTALVLFDPTNRQEPLSGVDFWLNQLKNKEQDFCNSILVGARTDRGTSTLTVEELQAYCERNGICGGYIPTSALLGDGLPELLECLKANIPWDGMTATVTTLTFKRIKEYVLELKEKTELKKVLVHPNELRAQLQATDPAWTFSDAEMMTAVGHLATHGYVTVLRGSQGLQSILLAPDLLANLASSIVLEARRNPRGLGVLEENRLLAGDYAFPELQNLDEDECVILIDAAVVLFLERNLCFRETFNQQTFMVFPSLINEKRPKDNDLTPVEGASYRIKGPVENVYASLVVLLGYTNTFSRTHQWQNQAQYEMDEKEICGFQQTSYEAGEIELVLYYADHTPEPVQLTFRGLFERFLSRRELEISRYMPVLCPKCERQLSRNVVMGRLAENENFSFCNKCGNKLLLSYPEPLTRLSRREEVMLDAQKAIAQLRTAFEAALVRIKALLRDRGEAEKPTCFISYAWGVPEHERWILQLAKDLRNAGIDVLLDRWHSPPGSDLGRYIDQIEASKFVVVVGTPELKQKYDSKTDDRVVAAELELINLRARQPKKYGRTTLPLLLAGDSEKSFPPQLQRLVSIDFRSSEHYFRQLFDTIWRIYNLPFDNPLLEELQASMSPRDE
jgi:small GTP-binding protein